MNGEPEDRLVEEIYDALDGGDPAFALARAKLALAGSGDDPVLLFLAGLARLEMDDPDGAIADLERAVELDPDDGEFRSILATALFRCGRFEEAADHARRVVESDPRHPAAHHVLGTTLEREGRFDEADRAFAKATRLDPDAFPPPVRIARSAFEREVVRAGELLPEAFRKHLDAVAVTVEDLPSDEILFAEQPALDPELLGLFVGRAIGESAFDGPGGDLPPRILLFQRNLERYADDERALRIEIARTLHHELAHYLGFEEDEMEGLDLD